MAQNCDLFDLILHSTSSTLVFLELDLDRVTFSDISLIVIGFTFPSSLLSSLKFSYEVSRLVLINNNLPIISVVLTPSVRLIIFNLPALINSSYAPFPEEFKGKSSA